jgi:translocation and assembly module TamB
MAEPASAPAPAQVPKPPGPPAAAPRRRRLVLRSVFTALFSLLLTCAVLAAAVAWLLGTTSGLNSIIALVNRIAPVNIEVQGSFGALTREFGFAEIKVTVDNKTIDATAFRAELRDWHWQPLRLDFDHLQARALRVDVMTDEIPIQNIGVPIALTVSRVTLGSLTVIVDGTQFGLQSIEGRATAGPDGYRVAEGRLAFGEHKAEVTAELGPARPFPLKAEGRLTAQVQDKAVGAVLRARGSLVDLTVEGELSGAAQGSFSAAIASFDKPAVKSLAVDLAGVDPRAWHKAAPTADLTVKATLTPNAAMDRVAGSIAIVNRAPGAIDAGRIPARSATAQVELDSRQLKLDRISGQLLQGSVSGDFSLFFGSLDWQARAKLVDVDPARLHGAVQPLRVDGQLQARQAGDAISVTADLENRGQPAATLAFDGQFTPRLARINTARLTLGSGTATMAGSVELTGAYRADLQGSLQRFEPGQLVKGIDARLSGSFLADGVLRPQPAGRIRFELDDSRAWGRPLAGRGRIDVGAEQHFDVDVDLSVRSARLLAKGGLGTPDRKLDVSLDVPAIDELLPSAPKTPLAGAVTLSGSVRGDWHAPEFQARMTGKGLRYGDHSLASLESEASYGGGADGVLSLKAGAADYRNARQPGAAAQTVTLSADGRLSSHGIRLQATADKAHGAIVYADGGWRDDAWRGRVREAAIGPPLDLRLLMPTELAIGAAGFQFGPAQFAVKHVRFDDVRVRTENGGVVTRGSFSGLQPTRFAVPIEGAMAPVLAPTGERTLLEFRGDWDLRLVNDIIDGHLLIERSAGDLYAGRGPDSALGLVDARLEARVTANRLAAITRIESARNGGLGAQFDAWLERSPDAGWRLAQARPWLISGAFDMPTMDWVNALLSDHLRANVRLGGRLSSTVRIEGTPANPTAAGQLTGGALRMAWVEQGVRLENGSLAAHLENDLLVLDELKFSGPPRVRPDDRRAEAALKDGEEGSVSANGQMRLGDFSGVIQVAASKLPLLQRPDRWVVASGGGNIETSADHVQVNGAFAAEAGFVGLARSDLPSLSSDVIVFKAEDAAASRARRVTLGFDLGIDLGQAFYMRGKGLSTRVEGAVRLRSAGRGAVTAVGSIEAVDGTYEGFGQKLKIARGRLNFLGAPENPGLDILALRTGLPVVVGVTITRTASAPLVRMHSDPPMADAEALSWLVLGRPPDQSGGDNFALVQAAASLLSGGGEGYSTRVAKAIGVDELSIRSGNIGIASLLPARSVAGSLRSDEASAATVSGEIITIGKNVSEALTVSYEQAISGTSRFLQLNYRLSQRLSVVARGGTDNALDLVYTIAFD